MNQALDIGTTLKLGWDTFVQAPVALILGFLVLLVLGGVSPSALTKTDPPLLSRSDPPLIKN